MNYTELVALLRTDLQNQEMNKIQAAITEQLREVTVRQTQLENLNQVDKIVQTFPT